MPRKSPTKTNTLLFLLNKLRSEQSVYYEQLDDLLSLRGYMVYTTDNDRLKIKLTGKGMSMKELRSLITAIDENRSIDHLLEERQDEHESQ